MNVEIPRAVFDENDSKAYFAAGNPAWSQAVRYGTKELVRPSIRCNCGVWCGIGAHYIHADGRVTASFYHAHTSTGLKYASDDGCGWHVFLKLKDYNCGEWPPEVI